MDQKISYDGCMIKILRFVNYKEAEEQVWIHETEVDSISELKFEILDEFRNCGAVLLQLQQLRLMGNVVFRTSILAKLT